MRYKIPTVTCGQRRKRHPRLANVLSASVLYRLKPHVVHIVRHSYHQRMPCLHSPSHHRGKVRRRIRNTRLANRDGYSCSTRYPLYFLEEAETAARATDVASSAIVAVITTAVYSMIGKSTPKRY